MLYSIYTYTIYILCTIDKLISIFHWFNLLPYQLLAPLLSRLYRGWYQYNVKKSVHVEI